MPNTEWWREFVTHIDYTDDEPFGVLAERVPYLLAQHRKMIVKEIRKEILHRATLRVQPVLELDGSRKSDDFYNAVYQILSLHCLKENE